MNKHSFKCFMSGVIVCILVISGTTIGFSQASTKTITAEYNGIKIYANGEELQLTDASGNQIEPFVYDGTTYLPIRAIGEALGTEILWEDSTKSIYLNKEEKQETSSQEDSEKDDSVDSESKENAEEPENTGESAAPSESEASEKRTEDKKSEESENPEPTQEEEPEEKPKEEESLYSRDNPAPIKTTQTIKLDNYTADVTVLYTYRGNTAMRRLTDTRESNPKAPGGKEYIVAMIEIKVRNVKDDKAVKLSPTLFKAFSRRNVEYERVSVTDPEPRMTGDIYSDGIKSAFVTFCVNRDDGAPKMAFGRNSDGTGGIWFKLD